MPGVRQGEAVQAVKRDLIAQLRESSRRLRFLGNFKESLKKWILPFLGGCLLKG